MDDNAEKRVASAADGERTEAPRSREAEEGDGLLAQVLQT